MIDRRAKIIYLITSIIRLVDVVDYRLIDMGFRPAFERFEDIIIGI